MRAELPYLAGAGAAEPSRAPLCGYKHNPLLRPCLPRPRAVSDTRSARALGPGRGKKTLLGGVSSVL